MVNYEEIFESSKVELAEVIKKTSLNDFAIQQELISAHLDFIVSLTKLVDCKNRIKPETEMIRTFEEKEVSDQQIAEVSTSTTEHIIDETNDSIHNKNEYLDRPPLIATDEEGKVMYLFERKLEGGFLSAITGYVSEGTIRKLELKHNDYVYARETDSLDDRKRYIYSFAQRGNGLEPPSRMQISYCLIEDDGSNLVVRKSMESNSNTYFIEHSEFEFIIQERDIERLSLKEGDLVDIAFYESFEDNHKVIWVHRFEEVKQFEPSVQKIIKGKINSAIEKVSVEQSLMNKVVLVVGNEPNKTYYEHEVVKRGGRFLWADAKANLTRLKSLVRKSDSVVFLLKVSGHTGMRKIKKYCKERGVPFLTTWSLSGATIATVSGENEIISS